MKLAHSDKTTMTTRQYFHIFHLLLFLKVNKISGRATRTILASSGELKLTNSNKFEWSSIESGLIGNDDVKDHHTYKNALEKLILFKYLDAIQKERSLGQELHPAMPNGVEAERLGLDASQLHDHNSKTYVSALKEHKIVRSVHHPKRNVSPTRISRLKKVQKKTDTKKEKTDKAKKLISDSSIDFQDHVKKDKLHQKHTNRIQNVLTVATKFFFITISALILVNILNYAKLR